MNLYSLTPRPCLNKDFQTATTSNLVQAFVCQAGATYQLMIVSVITFTLGCSSLTTYLHKCKLTHGCYSQSESVAMEPIQVLVLFNSLRTLSGEIGVPLKLTIVIWQDIFIP